MPDNNQIVQDPQPGQQTAIPTSNYDVNKDLGRVIDRTNVVDAPTAPNLLFNNGVPLTQGGNSKVNSVYGAYMGALKNTPSNFLGTAKFTNKAVADPYLTDAYGGFNPEDKNIANWYGENQGWFKQMGNRIGKLAVTTVGSFANSLLDIPNMVNAASEGNIDKAWNNPTNTWATDMQTWAENKLPNYETNWERQHPFLNLIPFYGNAGNGWGNVLQQVGFTVGAIGGSLVEDAIVGGITGGVGEIPLAAQQINKAVYKFGKMINLGEDALSGLKKSIKSADDIVTGLKGVDRFNYAVRKGLWGANMITSGASEAAFEGLDGFNQLNKDLTQEYFNNTGKMPDYDVQTQINKTARDAGNARFLMNVGLLAVTNSIQWGSLLKPFNVAKEAIEAEAKTGVKVALKEGSKDIFEAVNPTSKLARIGRALKNNIVSTTLTESASEGFEEGAQFAIQTGVDDFYKRKYHQPSIDQTNNFLKSFGTGLSKTLGSQEGWENIVYGVLGGAMYSGGEHLYYKLRGVESPNYQKQIQDVLQGLNTNTLSGIFENKYGEQVAADAIQDDMLKAAQSNNPFLYKNYQHEQMVNFVLSGIAQNKFETRMDQIDELNKLNDEDFKQTFGIPQTIENKKTVSEYVSSLKDNANYIKDVHDRVSRTFINPFNYKGTGNYKNAEQKAAQDKINEQFITFEDTKNQLTSSMSVAKNATDRINQMRAEMSTSNINIDEAVNLASDEGLKRLKKQYAEKAKFAQDSFNLTKDKASEKELNTYRNRISLIDEALDDKDATNAQKAYNNLLNDSFDSYNEVFNLLNNESGKPFDRTIQKEIMDRAKDINYLNYRTDKAIHNYATLTTKGGFKKLFDTIAALRKEVQQTPVPLTPEVTQPQNPQAAAQAAQTAAQNGVDPQAIPIAQQQNLTGELQETTREASPDEQRGYARGLINVVDGKDTGTSEQFDYVEEFSTIDELKMDNPKVDLTQYTKVKSSDGKNYYVANTTVAEMRAKAKGPDSTITNQNAPSTQVTPIPTGTGSNDQGLRTKDFLTKIFVPQDLKSAFQNAIFSGTPNILNFKTSISVKALSPELQQQFDDQKTNQSYTEIKNYPGVYVVKSPIDISILYDNIEIGKLAMPDRLRFKTALGFQTITEITPQQYSTFTSNPAAQHGQDVEQFKNMMALKNYLATAFKNNEYKEIIISPTEIDNILNAPSITYGTLNLVTQNQERALYNELEHKDISLPTKDGTPFTGNLILSIPRIYSNDMAAFVKTDHTNFIYNQAYYDNANNVDVSGIESAIAGDISAIQHIGSRYIAITSTPNGEKKYVALRPAELTQAAKDSLFTTIRDRAIESSKTNFRPATEADYDGFLLIGDQKVYYKMPSDDAKKFNDDFNTGISNQLFLSDPTGKTFMELSVSPIGAIRMEVYDRLNRVNNTLYIAPQKVESVNSMQDMLELFNKEIDKRASVKEGMTTEQIKNATDFKALNLKINSTNFRQNIGDDTKVTTDQIGSQLSAATSAQVYKDGTMNLNVNLKGIEAAFSKIGGNKQASTQTAPVTVAPTTEQTIQNIMDSQSQVEGKTEDNKFYIINGEQYRRVTSVIPNDFDGDTTLYENSRIAGSTVDGIVRKFFNGDSLTKPEGISAAAFDSIVRALNETKTIIDNRGEKFITNNIVLFDANLKIAGEVDILSIDKDGNFNIYDIKTAKDFGKYDSSYNGKLTKRENHTNQLSAYSNLFTNEFGITPKKLGIFPFEIVYDKDGIISSAKKLKGINITYNPEISKLIPLANTSVSTEVAPIVQATQEAITPAPITGGIFGGIIQIPTDDEGNPLPQTTQNVNDKNTQAPINQESNEDRVFTSAKEAFESVGIVYSNENYGTYRNIASGEEIEQLRGLAPIDVTKSMGLTVQLVKKSDPTEGFDFKRGDNGVDTLNRIVDINKIRTYIESILPLNITVEDIDNVLHHLENQGIKDPKTSVWGAFQDGVIYINTNVQDIGVEYHEAFHAVFAMLLPEDQRTRLLQHANEQQYLELKKKGTSIRDEIARNRKEGVWNNISYSEAIDKMGEEWMAEKFRNWKVKKENAGLLQKFFDLIAKFFKWITRNRTDLESLFNKIDTGYYKNSNVDTSFTNKQSTDDITPEISLMLIPARPGNMQVGKGNITLKRNLDSKTSKQVVQNVAAYFNTYRMLDKYNGIKDSTLLDTILDDLQALYSDKNPLYAGYTDAQKNRLASSDLSYIYSNQESRTLIKEGAIQYVNTIKYIEQFNDEDQEDSEQDKGQPSTGYDNTAENVGGFSSLPGLLRQYIGFTSYEKIDEFGNKQVVDGVPVVATVDAVSVYYGMMRSLANITDPIKFFQKMILFGNGNEQSRHFVDRFIKDTGLNVETLMQEGRLEASTNPTLVEMVKKGFNKFRIDYLFTQIDAKKKNAESYHANRKNVENTQFDKWSNQYANDYANYSEEAQSNIRKNIDNIRSSYFDERKNTKYDATRLVDATTRVQTALRRVGIHLSSEYIKYSLLSANAKKFDAANESYKKEGVSMQFDDPNNHFITKQDYDYVQIMKTSDETTLTPDILEQLSKLLSSGSNPYHKDIKELEIVDDNTNQVTKVQQEIDTAMIGRLLNVAKGNSLFDETVGESSFTNAEGKVVYAHQDGTFNVKFSYQLRDANYRKQLREQGFREQISAYRDANDSEWLTKNFLLNSNEFEAVADNLLFQRIEGLRAVETNKLGKVITQEFRDQKEGITYGHYSPREFLVNFMNIYVSYAQNQRTVQGNIITTPNLIRVLEASKTGDTVNLPVLSDLYKGVSITDKVKNLLFSEIKKEYDRITRVNGQIGTIKENIVENYHTGSFAEDGVTVTKGYRGLKFTDNTNTLIDKKLAERLEKQARAGEAISKEDERAIKNQIEGSLNNIVDKTVDVLVKEGIVNRNDKGEYSNVFLHNSYFKGNDSLNLGPRFKENIGHVLVNNYINTLAYNQILHGDSALSLKNDGGIDAVKRAKGDNAAIVSIRTDLINPELGITQPFTHSNVAIFKEPTNAEGVKIADAQMYTTVEGLRYTLWGLSKLTPRVARVLDALSAGENIHNLKDDKGNKYDAIFDKDNGLLRWDEMTNSLKLVYKDGKSYFKMSVVVLQPSLTSYKDKQGNWKAIPGWETLHNLRTSMENGKIHFAAPESASKMMTIDVAKADDFSDLVGHPYDNTYFGLQTANPSNKLSITTPTQLLQLIDSEQSDDTMVSINGRDTTVKQIKNDYQTYVSQKVSNDFNVARNEIYDIKDFNKDIEESIAKGEVTPRLANFQRRAVSTLETTGADAQLTDFFSLDDNGIPKYNLNMSSTKTKFQQLYLAYFSKGVLSQKSPGYTAALFSGIDTKTIRRAKRIENGVVIEWDHIRREHFLSNKGGIQNEHLLQSPEDVTEEGQLYLDKLRHNVTEYDENGKPTGNLYSEMMLPAHYKEFLDIPVDERLPDAISKGFGVRIPSQDKHSFMSLRMIDFLPTNLGSTGMFADDIVRLSGADFDIDKEYMSRYDFYTTYNDGKPTFKKYGSATTSEGKWTEYKRWMLDNNKTLKSVVNELTNQPINYNMLYSNEEVNPQEKQAIKDSIIEQALKQLGLPSTLEDFTKESENKELNNGVLNNNIVDSYISLLTNEGMREIANTAASLDILANIQKNEDITLRDKEGNVISTVFSKNTGYPVDSIIGQYYGFKNNTTGKDNIGIDVNANLIYSVLNKGAVKIDETEQVKPFEFDGITFDSFAGENEYNPDTKQPTGTRTNDILSTLISSATDEAKEQLNALYGLSVDALKTLNYMVGLKVPLKTAIYMVNQPAIRNYLDIKATKANNLQTLTEEKLFRDDFKEEALLKLGQDIKDYKDLSDDELYASLEQTGMIELKCD